MKNLKNKYMYQVIIGGGEWSDRWEEEKGLYTSEEFANERVAELHFKEGINIHNWIKIKKIKIIK